MSRMRFTSVLLICAGCSGGRFDTGGDGESGWSYRPSYNFSDRFTLPADKMADEGYALFRGSDSTAQSEILFKEPGLDGVWNPVFTRSVIRAYENYGHGCTALGEGYYDDALSEIVQDLKGGYEGYDDCVRVIRSNYTLSWNDDRLIRVFKHEDSNEDVGVRRYTYPTYVELNRVNIAYENGWRDVSNVGAPPELSVPQAIWTGKVVIVLGRNVSNGSLSLSYYDVGLDTWSTVQTADMPAPAGDFKTIWTGNRLIIVFSGGGAILDPVTNAWKVIKTDGAPTFDSSTAKGSFAAAFGGEKLYVFGSVAGTTPVALSGAVYDLGSEVWTPISMVDAPQTERYLEATWTSFGILVWANGLSFYHPTSNIWKRADVGSRFSFPTTPDEQLPFDAHLVPTGDGVWVQPFVAIGPEGRKPGSGRFFNTQTQVWAESEMASFPQRKTAPVDVGGRGFLSFSGASPRWYANEDSDELVELASGGEFYDRLYKRTLTLSQSPTAPTLRGDAAIVMADDTLFVWGGCATLYKDGLCALPLKNGKVAKLVLPRVATPTN